MQMVLIHRYLQYPKDIWEKETNEILDTLSPDVPAEELYCEEKMYDRPVGYRFRSIRISILVIKYEEILKLKYPKELLKKYKTELSQMAISARGRKNTRKLPNFFVICRA